MGDTKKNRLKSRSELRYILRYAQYPLGIELVQETILDITVLLDDRKPSFHNIISSSLNSPKVHISHFAFNSPGFNSRAQAVVQGSVHVLSSVECNGR